MKTKITEMLGIEFPILGFTHCRDVAAAVTNAGGMGVLGAGNAAPEELEWMEAEIGPDRVYGLDTLIPAKSDNVGNGSPRAVQDLLPEEHKKFLTDLLARYDVPPLPEGDGAMGQMGSMMLSDNSTRAANLIDIATHHPQVKLVASALGPPPRSMVDVAHEHGILVAALVGNRQHAERQVAAGVDVIVAQGYEAGGHVGEIGSMVLIPEIVDTVAPLPVLAAGGIGSGRQLAAALALGAQGVWCGSVWLTTAEAETHPVVKRKFLAASSSDTVRSRASTGKPARQLRSAWTDEWENPANPAPLGMPLHTVLTNEARQRIQRAAHKQGSGAEQLINYFVGQIVGSMNQEKTTRQVVLEMVEEYIDVAQQFVDMMSSSEA
ncbi:MAG: nitronate monooxygenase [Acidimicrobiales bacterium]|nr:nitronate monooxygenase [Acidimicrobiales bacterium]